MKFLIVFVIAFFLAQAHAAPVDGDADDDIALAMLNNLGLDDNDMDNSDVKEVDDDNESQDPIDANRRDAELDENDSKDADNSDVNLEDNASLEADPDTAYLDTIDERSVDDTGRSSRSLEAGRKLRSLHYYRGGKYIRSSMTIKYFKATDFGQCMKECVRRSCSSFSYRWDGYGYCRISKNNVDSSKLFTWSKYDTYRLTYSSIGK